MKITLIAGSNRKDATSTKLLHYIRSLMQTEGIGVTLIDLYETPLPFYSADETSSHPHVKHLLEAVSQADGLVLATPEYHGSISGVLKNALDYVSGSIVGGKPVLSVSSAGGAVGVSSLTQLQAIVRNLHGINSPEWISIGSSQRFFDEDGAPLDEPTRVRVTQALNQFIRLTTALKASAV
ncbi:NADPH-dependent FMN reductase [Paenibacillus sambharensis]|uniref:NADPH-dependent FMN reductase n=1 Tax=Paenibacillus sambharensis TaxID=1803190 RepID=A0A2W1LET8_9BACL|nr:NADPH-dependent FMN reductase [Paenibacillus sambharensis]PZD97606.1 NADPH-dependent FMN reductase [Paenibacillus sambharensis]